MFLYQVFPINTGKPVELCNNVISRYILPGYSETLLAPVTIPEVSQSALFSRGSCLLITNL